MPRKSAAKSQALSKLASSGQTTKKKTAAKLASPEGVRPAETRVAHTMPTAQVRLPNAFKLFASAIKLPIKHWEIFGGIMLIYAISNIILIGGLVGVDEFRVLKDLLYQTFTGQFSGFSTSLSFLSFLASGSTGTAASGAAGSYQTVLLTIFSLAFIWALRQTYAGNVVRVRDALYKGMQPLIPYLLVVLIIGFQLIPAIVGAFLFTIFESISSHTYELVIAGAICFLLAAWTIYMLISSILALYIVTLPDMTPLEALRSARDIVRRRRGSVLRKLLFLPVALAVAATIIMLPVTLLLTPAAPYVFFFLTLTGILVVHSYMYTLYRELINHTS